MHTTVFPREMNPASRGGKRALVEESRLQWQPIAVILVLALIWGANMASIKIAARDMAPLFMAGVRSLVAGVGLFIWMKIKGIKVFPSRTILFHGMVIGALFGSEFGLVYEGLEFTLASRAYVLLYTAPFFAALGAHFFLQGDRLNPWKAAGLAIAFFGVVILFLEKIGPFSVESLPGDLMALAGGALWGATTVYVKKFLAYRTRPLQTLFYQVSFSAPLLFALSFLMESPMVKGVSLIGLSALFYQCIIVAFLSYLVWFELIHRYPVSLLHAFSFFTPVFGVFLSGVLILGEPLHLNLLISLVLVSAGMVLVNRKSSRDTIQ
jgi:drug/metabolite transporter (DMT)-like permease